MTLPDGPMQSLLSHARRYSTDDARKSEEPIEIPITRAYDEEIDNDESRRHSINILNGYLLERRLSEAGVNRRPSAAQILTEDTDSFIIGETVYVDGVKRGRIQYIGETKFGPGEWAGIFLEEPLGKNDGSVGSSRYFQCEPKHGVFSKLFRLTREPIDGADEVLSQMRKYGYEIMEAPQSNPRRGSVGSSGGGGSRRGSMSLDDYHHHPHHLHHHLNPRRGSTDRGSMSPRQPRTPEMRRTSVSRASPDTTGCLKHDPNRRGSGVGQGDRRTSLNVPERRGSGAFIPPHSPRGRRVTPGKSPLASPRNSRSNLGISKPIDKDPDVSKLVSEARRLSLGGSGRRGSGLSDQLADEVRKNNSGSRRPSTDFNGRRSSSNPRRTSESSSSSSGGGYNRSPLLQHRNSRSEVSPSNVFSRKTSESLGLGNRRSSSSENNGKYSGVRRPSSDLEASELLDRRQSEAGLRRSSATDVILNEDTSNLRVGMPVYVDGTKPGRIAYIGDVHFAQGIMAGVHLEKAQGKNRGSIGGIMYFQCEPKRGVFSRLHRLTLYPIN